MSSTPFQQQFAPESTDVEMMDIDSRVDSRVLEVDENGVPILPDGAKWKGPIPVAYPQSGWSNIPVSPNDAVEPYEKRPNWAANGVEVSLRADVPAGDPLLTEYSVDTWVGTMFIFISRMMGETKFKYYKNLVLHFLDKRFLDQYTGEEVDPRAEGSLFDFLAQNPRVCYLHNDIARQLDIVPVFPDLPPADEEIVSLIKRIADDWGRELRIENGQPVTRNGDRVGREDDDDFEKEACLTAMEVLAKWTCKIPKRGRGVGTLLAAFGGIKM